MSVTIYKLEQHNELQHHHSKHIYIFFYLLVSVSWVFFLLKFWFCCGMSQNGLIRYGLTERKAAMPKRKIKIPHFDNSALIAGYLKTSIGRCMNPHIQDMKTHLFMLPCIWQLEGKVVGADMGIRKVSIQL